MAVLGNKSFQAKADTVNSTDVVAIVKLQNNRADNIIQSRTQPAARYQSTSQFAGVKVYWVSGTGKFKRRDFPPGFGMYEQALGVYIDYDSFCI